MVGHLLSQTSQDAPQHADWAVDAEVRLSLNGHYLDIQAAWRVRTDAEEVIALCILSLPECSGCALVGLFGFVLG